MRHIAMSTNPPPPLSHTLQINGYLRSHAHDQMLGETPILPVNMTDQIVLWGKERDRMTFTKGVLYDNFRTPEVCVVLVWCK